MICSLDDGVSTLHKVIIISIIFLECMHDWQPYMQLKNHIKSNVLKKYWQLAANNNNIVFFTYFR